MNQLHFAPLQGYVDNAYRRLHAELYGGADCYYTPFIRIDNGAPRHQDMKRLSGAVDDGTPLVPQIIFGSVDEFSSLVDAVKRQGFKRIDLNLGCPFAMQTKKGRGAAMIANVDVIRRIAELIADDPDVEYSLKMRLGLDAPDQWRALVPTLNSIKLKHITMHPRVATQMYSGDIDMSRFDDFASSSKNPVIFNGEIHCADDIAKTLETYPNIAGVMIGRGILARPSLMAEYREGRQWGRNERVGRLLDFHARLLDEYMSTLCGQTQILQKIKPFWEYLEPEIGHKALKAIKKAVNINKYNDAVAAIG